MAMKIQLAKPDIDSHFSLAQSLAHRRSVRQFKNTPLSLNEITWLLWAGQGISDPSGYRTAPSAGALYPLELYLIAGMVNGLSAGMYHYRPENHQLIQTLKGDLLDQLANSALGQSAIKQAPASLVITAVYERTTGKYGKRGIRYVHMDAGHAAQNICLQATALGLGTVPIGAFQDEQVAQTLLLPDMETPLYILPMGRHV